MEICQQLVVPHLQELRVRYPGLRLEPVADDRVADLATERVDVALRSTVGRSELVVARELDSFHRRLHAAPEYLRRQGEPAQPDDVAAAALVEMLAPSPRRSTTPSMRCRCPARATPCVRAVTEFLQECARIHWRLIPSAADLPGRSVGSVPPRRGR